jgi:hypothetical protein
MGHSFRDLVLAEPRWSSAKGWESAKRRLSFAKLTQDDDEEGALILDRLPTMAEATEIRMVLGIPKRVEYSFEALAVKQAQALMAREKRQLLSASSPIGGPRSHYHVFCSEKGNHAGYGREDSSKLKFYYSDLPEELQAILNSSSPQ